jgi:hypothetical protein
VHDDDHFATDAPDMSPMGAALGFPTPGFEPTTVAVMSREFARVEWRTATLVVRVHSRCGTSRTLGDC